MRMFRGGQQKRGFVCVGICILLAWVFCQSNLTNGIYVAILFLICFKRLMISFVRTGKFLIFDPYNYFLSRWFLIFGIGYYSYVTRLKLGIAVFDHKEILVTRAIIISILSVVILTISYRVGMSKIRIRVVKPAFLNLNIHEKSFWHFLFIVILAFFLFWSMMGTVPLFSPGYHDYGRTELGKGLGYIEAIAKGLMSATLLYYVWKLYNYKRFDIKSIMYFFLIALINFLNEDRAAIVGYSLNIAFIYYVCVKPIKSKYLVFGASLLVTFAGLVGVMRALQSSNENASMSSVISTEVSVEFDNYVEVFNMFEKKKYLGGETLLPILTLPIPRTIMPEKDRYQTAGVFFKEYHDHSYIRTAERVTGIGELYMNFGYIGIIVGMMILGFILAYLTAVSFRLKSIFGIYMYIQIIGITQGVIGSDVPSVLINFFIGNSLIIIYLIWRNCFKH